MRQLQELAANKRVIMLQVTECGQQDLRHMHFSKLAPHDLSHMTVLKLSKQERTATSAHVVRMPSYSIGVISSFRLRKGVNLGSY